MLSGIFLPPCRKCAKIFRNGAVPCSRETLDGGAQEKPGGLPLNTSPNDLALIAVMRRYFSLKEEAGALKARLEDARKAAGDEIDRFYDPRRNAPHAEDILVWHRLRREMDELMSLAATWGRGGSIDAFAPASAAEPAFPPETGASMES